MIFKNSNDVIWTWPKILLAMLLLLLLPACTQFLFQPQRILFTTPDQFGVVYEQVRLESSDKTDLHGWKLQAKAEQRGTILFFHGNGENISSHFLNVHWLTDFGYDVYLFDYRGYGRSEGVAQLDAVIEDATAMLNYGVSKLAKDEKLIVIGHSLGGSLGIHAVAHSEHKARIKTLISVEAFSDYHEVAQDVLATGWLTWLFQWPLSFTVDNSYRPLDSVAQISPVSLMLMHSKQDEMIPVTHAEALYQAAEEPKKLQLVSGSHNEIFNQKKNRGLRLRHLNER